MGLARSPRSLQHNYHTLSSNVYVTRHTALLKMVGRGFSLTPTQTLVAERLNINGLDLELKML